MNINENIFHKNDWFLSSMFKKTIRLSIKKTFTANKLIKLYIMADIDNSSNNSFLEETDHNSNINSCVRREIELRYSQSTINKIYKFPRDYSLGKKRSLITLKEGYSLKNKANKNTRNSSTVLNKSPYNIKLPKLRDTIKFKTSMSLNLEDPKLMKKRKLIKFVPKKIMNYNPIKVPSYSTKNLIKF